MAKLITHARFFSKLIAHARFFRKCIAHARFSRKLITHARFFRYGRQPPPEPTSPIALSANEVGHHHHHHHHEPFTSSRSGQILWIRGLTRLQTQVGPPCLYTLLWFPLLNFLIVIAQCRLCLWLGSSWRMRLKADKWDTVQYFSESSLSIIRSIFSIAY